MDRDYITNHPLPLPLENIFNAGEFGLFYQCLPNKTLHLKGEKCSGGKHSKVRLTGLAAGNAYGERLQMFVIGKSVKPRCFKGVKTVICRYRAQHKSWMSAELFEDWAHELDRKFAVSKRKIALIIDNCTAHPYFSLYFKFGEAMMRSLKELNFNVEKEYVFNKKQTLISDFFLKQ